MSVAKMKDGRWYCSFYYKDAFGVRHRKKKEGFRTKREAVAYEDQQKKLYNGNCDMSVSSLWTLYLESAKQRMKASTIHTKEAIFENKIKPYFGDTPARDVTPLMIHNWQTALIGKGHSETYLRTINNVLCGVMSYAERYYGLTNNPCKKEPRMGKRDADAMQFWTIDEFNAVLEHESDLQLRTIYEVLFWTGLRKGECFALTRADIDLEQKIISITKTLHRYQSKNVITSPKTERSNRIVNIPQHLADVLRDYIAALYKPSKNDLIFTTSPGALNACLNRAAARAGVKKIRVHDLRHSHASLLIEMGCSPLLIAERLGHDSVDTTLRIYSHLYPNKQADVAAQLNQWYENSTIA